MEQNNEPEAIDVANKLEKGFITLGKTARALRYEAAETIRRLHARVEELEKDRGNAKRLVSKIWNQHPEARDTIEKATGAWLVFGQDVETSGVSAQRATQRAIDSIGKPSWDSHQWPQIVQDSSGNWFGVRDGWTMRVAPTYKGDELWLLREDGEFLSHGECSQGWRTSLEQRPTTKPTPAVLNLDDYYCKGCGRIGEIEELSAQDKAKLRKLDGKPKTAPVMEPVLSDVLPSIGSRVFIRHRRDNDAHACIVTGYYAWEDDGGNPMLHRVFVRLVYEGTNTSQSCILCECHPSAEAALAATPTTAAQSEVPKVGSAWRHKNGNAYRVVAIANDCDAHFSERYPVTVVYQGENGKMWARRADDWHRSMTHDATSPSTALVERPG